jgi:hypothetical protein
MSKCFLASAEALAHIPDITTKQGLLDLIMVGNMLEFGHAFDRNIPGKKAPPAIVEERNVAMWRYRIFQSWFNKHYILDISGQGVNPCYIFSQSLISFAAAMCAYVKRWEMKTNLGVSPMVVTLVYSHIRSEWQDLLLPFERLCRNKGRAHKFVWPHDFRILRRDESQVWTELLDCLEDPIYTNTLMPEDDLSNTDGDTSDEEPPMKRLVDGAYACLYFFSKLFILYML